MKPMLKHPRVWTYRLSEDCLCCWAKPFKQDLVEHGQPTPNATMQQCRLVPEGEYRKLKAAYDREQADGNE